MKSLLKIFLPYSFFFGLLIAVFASHRRADQPVVTVVAPSPTAGVATPVSSAIALPKKSAPHASMAQTGEAENHAPGRATDPVCHMEVALSWGFSARYKGHVYHFCTTACRDRFAANPEAYLGARCVVCRQRVDPQRAVTATYMGNTYQLCSEEHRAQFKADPASYFMHTMWGIPPWMYYVSIGFVLLVSFGAFDLLDRRGDVPVVATRRASSRNRLPGTTPAASQIDGTQPGTLPSSRLDDASLHAQATAASDLPTTTQTDRLDLLQSRLVRWMVTSRRFRFACQAIIVALFFLVIAAGLFGNQNPALNIAPLLTWTIWWGGLVVLIMFAGKAWCYVCPWDAVAGWMQRWHFWRKTDEGMGLDLKWPRALRNIVLATLLFVGLTWIELGFGVTMKPRVTAYLAIAMLLMAIVSAFLFERKGFCRYACLVGRVSGLYAMFSGVEIRPKSQDVCRTCVGKECYRGSQTAYGCPTFLFPGNLSENTYCIQCTECIQACPQDNLALNLRPWGADLVSQHRVRTDEAYLALLMLSITGFHGLTMTPNWNKLIDWLDGSFSLGHVVAFSLGMSGLMLLPILIYAALVYISYRLGNSGATVEKMSYRGYFIRYAYALLPIALFYHLAHNLEHLLMEGPKIVTLISDPFGWGWNLFGTLNWHVPPLVSLDVLWILQVLLVLVGHVFSLHVAQRTSVRLFGGRRAAWRSQLPMLAGMIAFSVFSLWLLKQPMEMRTSAM